MHRPPERRGDVCLLVPRRPAKLNALDFRARAGEALARRPALEPSRRSQGGTGVRRRRRDGACDATPRRYAYYRDTGDVYERLAALQPIVAAIHGWCVGGGLESRSPPTSGSPTTRPLSLPEVRSGSRARERSAWCGFGTARQGARASATGRCVRGAPLTRDRGHPEGAACPRARRGLAGLPPLAVTPKQAIAMAESPRGRHPDRARCVPPAQTPAAQDAVEAFVSGQGRGSTSGGGSSARPHARRSSSTTIVVPVMWRRPASRVWRSTRPPPRCRGGASDALRQPPGRRRTDRAPRSRSSPARRNRADAVAAPLSASPRRFECSSKRGCVHNGDATPGPADEHHHPRRRGIIDRSATCRVTAHDARRRPHCAPAVGEICRPGP